MKDNIKNQQLKTVEELMVIKDVIYMTIIAQRIWQQVCA